MKFVTLLDWEINTVYSGQNVYFDERPTNLMVGPQCVEWSENKDPQLPKMIEEQVLAREGDETSVIIDVVDRLGIDIVTGDSNNGADVQSEVGVLV